MSQPAPDAPAMRTLGVSQPLYRWVNSRSISNKPPDCKPLDTTATIYLMNAPRRYLALNLSHRGHRAASIAGGHLRTQQPVFGMPRVAFQRGRTRIGSGAGSSGFVGRTAEERSNGLPREVQPTSHRAGAWHTNGHVPQEPSRRPAHARC